ncbi:MAG: M81 family metallopeptidase [Propylenella sp.]
MHYRVAVGGMWHETNSFSPIATDLASFRRYQYLEGSAITERLKGTNCEIGGMIEAAEKLGVALIPTLFAGALPSGMVTRDAFDHITGRIAESISAALPLDGVLLSLHGAMVAEGVEEADAELVQRVRRIVGPHVPVVATFDSHANLSPAIIDAADLLIGYDTLPHIDMAERGREAATLLRRLVAGEERPHAAFRKLPLLTVPQMQATIDPPMAGVMQQCHEIERQSGIWTACVALGFPYCDVPQLGMAVLVYGTEADQAETDADRLANALWRRRAEFLPTLLSPEDAVRQALAADRGPVMLVEPADNVGGGAPGDGTTIAAALIAAEAKRAVATIWDSAAAARAAGIGVGAVFTGKVGGQTIPLHGPPLDLSGTVDFIGRVSYRRDKAYFYGQEIDLGEVAVIDANGTRIILTSERLMPFDTMHLRVVGIEPEAMRVIALKCGSNWSVAFGDIAASSIYVDTPGICSSNLDRIPLTRLPWKTFPRWPDATRASQILDEGGA